MKTHTDYLVKIRESECIGCTKCIDACPFDAIIGAHNLMHTVITDACNGCKLCIPPCPVDCIDLIELPERTKDQRKNLAAQSRERYQKHKARIENNILREKEEYQKMKEAILSKVKKSTGFSS